MPKTKDQLLLLEFENYLELNDLENIKNNLPKLLKSYVKNAKRTERILKQTDSQQLNVLKLTEKLEESNSQVKNLLDNVGQGFIYFDNNMKIGKEYSAQAQNIFNKNIYNLDITKLLYPKDKSKSLFLTTTLQNILTDNVIKQEILISLLETEFIINGKDIEIEYKVLNESTFMMILTDITDKKELDKKVKQEQQTLKMIVEVVSSLEQFLEIKTDYDIFVDNIDNYKTIDKLSLLRMEIHTYKGLFAQKEMLHIVDKLHNFETLIDKSILSKKIFPEILQIDKNTMLGWINDDIEILKNILGEDFFNKSNFIEIKKNRIDELYNKIEEFSKDEISQGILELKYNHIMVFLRPYKKLIEQLSTRLNKSINPLLIDCDDIYIDNKFKPFLNSLIHIFRNSVDHGIETLDERFELGKTQLANIKCYVKKRSNHITITICDDGRGINLDIIKQIAIKKSLYTEDEFDSLSEDEKLKIIFKDSFSTAKTITTISGRGVGLASVMYELNKLNGRLSITNKPKEGIEFNFYIPLNIEQLNVNNDNDKIKKTFLEKLSLRTIEYFKEYLDINIDHNIDIKCVNKVEFHGTTGLISLSKDMQGTVGMSVSDNLSVKMVKNFIFGNPSETELNELKDENIAETLNVVLGNILQDLPIVHKGGKIDISSPYIMTETVCVYKKKYGQMFMCKLHIDDEIIVLSYFL